MNVIKHRKKEKRTKGMGALMLRIGVVAALVVSLVPITNGYADDQVSANSSTTEESDGGSTEPGDSGISASDTEKQPDVSTEEIEGMAKETLNSLSAGGIGVSAAGGNASLKSGPSAYVVTGALGGNIGAYSTLQDAFNACVSGETCTVTLTENSTEPSPYYPPYNSAINLEAGKSVVLTSDTGSQQLDLNATKIVSKGSLTIENITVANGRLEANGASAYLKIDDGVVVNTTYYPVVTATAGAFFEMTGGTLGGGNYQAVSVYSGSSFTMSGGLISGFGQSSSWGGGTVNITSGSFEMSGGEISNNKGTMSGGGVNLSGSSAFTMTGGTISDNVLSSSMSGGGGVSVGAGSTFDMQGGSICNNKAGGGGGISVAGADASFDNPADTTSYSNISISGTAVVSGNTSNSRQTPPINKGDFTNFDGNLLNNDDIYYFNPGNPAVAYYSNNSANETYYDPDHYGVGNTVTVSSYDDTGFTEEGAVEFDYWCTTADGVSGIIFEPDDTFTIADNVWLYAIYKARAQTFDVTVELKDRAGADLAPADTFNVDSGSAFTATDPGFADHTLVDWKLNGISQGNTTPMISAVTANATITLVYGQDKNNDGIEDFTITEECYCEANSIANNHEVYVNKGDNYSDTPQTVSNYNYKNEYQVDGGAMQTGTPSISNVQAPHTVRMLYDAQAGPGPGPDPTPDHGNYQFIKKPNVKNVSPGEMVTYTFSGFANNWPFEIEHYSITDKPDRGIDFKGAKLPAFNNGSGVTYDVVIYTSTGSERVLYSDVSAASPFSFNAPSLGAGEYITAVELDFGTVPAGFASGNTLEMSFRVWDNPPAQKLYNSGILSYKVGDEYKEFVTGGEDGSITLGGSFGPLPQTGDISSLMVLAVVGISGASVLAVRRRGKKKIGNSN